MFFAVVAFAQRNINIPKAKALPAQAKMAQQVKALDRKAATTMRKAPLKADELVTAPNAGEQWYIADGSLYAGTKSGWDDVTSRIEAIHVCIDGSDIYIQGLAFWFPEGWIKGTINGSTATFPCGQMVGEDDYGPEYMVGQPAGAETGEEPGVDIVFDYDAVAGTLSLNASVEAILESNTPNTINHSYCYWSELVLSKRNIQYNLTYLIDGVLYKQYSMSAGQSITPEAAPTKEGYTFSGWSTIPSTMPADDVTITGSFTKNSIYPSESSQYILTYIVDGAVYKQFSLSAGQSITPEAAPTKDGYTFSGWSTIPSTMPANDVTITGTFTKNNVSSSGEPNSLAMSNISAAKGTQVVLPIQLNNTSSITALQMDLYLPVGVNIAKDGQNEEMIELGNRTTYKAHGLAYNQQQDGAMRITCSSNSSAAFSGSSGVIINVTLDVTSSVATGDNTISMRNIELTDIQGNAYHPSQATCKLTVSGTGGEIQTNDKLNVVPINVNRGEQVVLPIGMTNERQITGIQFDLYLPAGVSVATNSKGKMLINTTERMDGNYSLTGSDMGGYVRIVGYSADSDPFSGTNGDILNVTLNVAESMQDGTYAIQLKDIVLSDVYNKEFHPADVSASMTVKSYTLGDVDNSGAININDVVCIINHILNKANGVFIREAADVDGSGAININDVVTLINRFILKKSSAPRKAPRLVAMTDDNYMSLATIDIKPGETKEVALLLNNQNEVKAVQGNLKLPAGLTFATKSNGRLDVKNNDSRSEDFTLSCALQDDGSMTFAHYSADGFAYDGNEGGIFIFKIKADENAAPGSYEVKLSEMVLSIEGVAYEEADRTCPLNITSTNGISEITIDDSSQVYTLDGLKVSGKPTKPGVYIRNGRKFVVK